MNTFSFSPRITGLLSAAVLAALVIAPALPAAPDISKLPDYKPTMEVTGLLRTHGNDQMAGLFKLWEQGFEKLHPHVRFNDRLQGSGSGMYGIELSIADMAAMGRPINPFERYGTYERGWAYPIEVEVATGC